MSLRLIQATQWDPVSKKKKKSKQIPTYTLKKAVFQFWDLQNPELPWKVSSDITVELCRGGLGPCRKERSKFVSAFQWSLPWLPLSECNYSERPVWNRKKHMKKNWRLGCMIWNPLPKLTLKFKFPL
jgi:hypothetical protein